MKIFSTTQEKTGNFFNSIKEGFAKLYEGTKSTPLVGYYVDISKEGYSCNRDGRIGFDLSKLITVEGEQIKVCPSSPSSQPKESCQGSPPSSSSFSTTETTSTSHLPRTNDMNYIPVGERMGNISSKFNLTILAAFGCGTGEYMDNEGQKQQANEQGILLPGGRYVFLDENKGNCDNGNTCEFYKSLRHWKTEFNNHKALLGIAIGGEKRTVSEFPGQFTEDELQNARTSQSSFKKFIDDYCNEGNERFQTLKRFILQVHSVCNFVEWDFERTLYCHPALILSIGAAYNSLNSELNKSGVTKDRLWYSISLPCDLNGLDVEFVEQWHHVGANDIFKHEHQFQRPWVINCMMLCLKKQVWEQKFSVKESDENSWNNMKKDMKNIHKVFVKSPMESMNVFKELLGVSTETHTKKRIVLKPWINHYEPVGMEERGVLIDPVFIDGVTRVIKDQGFGGICLWEDRSYQYSDDNKLVRPPSTTKFDISMGKLYSKHGEQTTTDILAAMGVRDQDNKSVEKLLTELKVEGDSQSEDQQKSEIQQHHEKSQQQQREGEQQREGTTTTTTTSSEQGEGSKQQEQQQGQQQPIGEKQQQQKTTSPDTQVGSQ